MAKVKRRKPKNSLKTATQSKLVQFESELEKRLMVLEWDVEDIAKSLQLTVDETRKYFRDGRRTSFLMEHVLAARLEGSRPPDEEQPYDMLDKDGYKWEIRCLTGSGVYFVPSYMKGKGRSFDENGFLDKLKDIKGYYVCDIRSFPRVSVWCLSSKKVLNWWQNRILTQDGTLHPNKADKLLIA